jgi:hypothetical protein
MLMGCLGNQAEPIVAVKTEYVEQRIPIQEAPKGVNFPPVEWFILTPDNIEAKIAEIEASTGSAVLFAITPKGYENLAIGIGDLRRYIKDEQAIVGYYEEALAPEEPAKEE